MGVTVLSRTCSRVAPRFSSRTGRISSRFRTVIASITGCAAPSEATESPLTCVAVGSGRSLEEFEAIHRSNRSQRSRRNGPRR